MPDLIKEYEYYQANQRELAERYHGRVLVIKEQEVIGVFDSELEALEDTKTKHELGTFLIQKSETPEESNPQVFHSRFSIR